MSRRVYYHGVAFPYPMPCLFCKIFVVYRTILCACACPCVCMCFVCCLMFYSGDGHQQTTLTTSVMSTQIPAVTEVDISVVSATLSTDQDTADTLNMKSSQHTATQTSRQVPSSSTKVSQVSLSTSTTAAVGHTKEGVVG